MTDRAKLFTKLWTSGVTTEKIAQALGISQRQVRRVRGYLKLVPRPAGRPRSEDWR